MRWAWTWWPSRKWGRVMATYSTTFAHIRRQKAADYRRRKKAAKQVSTKK
jgi:hypothetical protein